MAFNKINIIKSDLSARLAYISNPDKTGSCTLIAGVNCSPYVPYADMMDTKLRCKNATIPSFQNSISRSRQTVNKSRRDEARRSAEKGS